MTAPKRHGRTDALFHAYDVGPFPGVDMAPFSATLVDLMERLTGEPFSPSRFAHYERVRAFLAHDPIAITPVLRARQVLSDPMLARGAKPPVYAPGARRVAADTAPAAPMPHRGGFDPADLGD